MDQQELLQRIEQAAKEKATTLNLSHNQLTELPPEIGQLTSLTTLDLDSNQLTALPEQIGQLINLQTLYLNSNQLTALPEQIGQLTSLQTLYLQDNQLSELPSEIGQLEALRILGLNDIPSLRFPPEEIVALDVEAIRSFLRAALKGSDYVWESKVLLVGEGGVGKTTLFEVLNGRPFDAHEEGTVGIVIGPLDLPHPTEPDVTMRLNCWDFAGQDFNHATHQFFFSDRALFLLVWNARHGYQQGKLYRWLENIKVRAPQARVILVATHIDEPHSDYPAADLEVNYPQIVGQVKVSNKEGEGISELRSLIQEQATALPLMGLRWPATWLEAAEEVRALTDKHISRRNLHDLMQEHGLSKDEAGVLTHWLHDLGDILHFHDEPEMRERVVLDPEWVTRHVGLVLRSEEVQAQHGILTRTHLDALWDDLDDFIRDLFLRMMDKFDLAYLIPDDPEDRSLIVERLSHDPVAYQDEWDAFEDVGTEIKLRYRLGSMQPGIPTWFIARCHRFTMDKHWLFGVLFRDADEPRHLALVQADQKDGIVDMTVRGPFPQRFLSLLRDGFKDTLKRYKGLEVQRLVPCPGYNTIRDKPCENEFKLDLLEEKLIQNPTKITFECNDCDTELSRLELVEGIGAAAITQKFTEERIAALIKEEHQKTRAHIDLRIEDVLAFAERNFINAWKREQERELITCPNVFILKTVGKGGLFTAKKFELQLYCQQPGHWHSIEEPGRYEFAQTAEWFKKAAPYLLTLVDVLKVVSSLAGPVLSMGVAAGMVDITRNAHEFLKGDFKAMSTLLKELKAEDFEVEKLGEMAREVQETPTYRKFKGADLVAIRELMDQLADRAPKWGGLTRRQTPEGDLLWLCKNHLREYESKRKVVPFPDEK